MRSRGTRELVVCAALGAIAFAFSFSIATPDAAVPALPTEVRSETRLTALAPPSAKAAVRKLIRADSPPSAIWAALQRCASHELAELFQLTTSPSTRALRANRLLVLARWSEVDPIAAADAASGQWDAFINVPMVVSLWADLDVHAALDYVDTYQSRIGTGLAYTAAIASAREQGDVDLQPLFARLPQDERSIELTHTLVTGDRLAALRGLLPSSRISGETSSPLFPWAAGELADELLENHAPSEIIEVYAEDTTGAFGDPSAEILAAYFDEDPVGATGWISARDDPFEAARLGIALAKGLIETRPQDAADVLEQLPGSTGREELFGDLAESWQASDQQAFGLWRDQLGDEDRQAVERMLREQSEAAAGEEPE